MVAEHPATIALNETLPPMGRQRVAQLVLKVHHPTAPRGMRTFSTICWMCSGGSFVTLSTANATMKVLPAPTTEGFRRDAEEAVGTRFDHRQEVRALDEEDALVREHVEQGDGDLPACRQWRLPCSSSSRKMPIMIAGTARKPRDTGRPVPPYRPQIPGGFRPGNRKSTYGSCHRYLASQQLVLLA